MGRSDDHFPVSIFLIMRIFTKILGYRKLEICVNYKKINVDHVVHKHTLYTNTHCTQKTIVHKHTLYANTHHTERFNKLSVHGIKCSILASIH